MMRRFERSSGADFCRKQAALQLGQVVVVPLSRRQIVTARSVGTRLGQGQLLSE